MAAMYPLVIEVEQSSGFICGTGSGYVLPLVYNSFVVIGTTISLDLESTAAAIMAPMRAKTNIMLIIIIGILYRVHSD